MKMTKRLKRGNLQVSETLATFIENEATAVIFHHKTAQFLFKINR